MNAGSVAWFVPYEKVYEKKGAGDAGFAAIWRG
jgi:hypothetical protein